MSDDLIRRLRLWGDTVNLRRTLRDLCNEAAGEIERLRLKAGEPLGEKIKNDPDVI